MTTPPATAAMVDDFIIDPKPDPSILTYKGRAIGPVPADQVDAQFRLADGGSLVLASDPTPFREHLAVIYVDATLHIRDVTLVGGAYPNGALTYAHATSPDTVVFCFHDLEHEVTVGRRRTWLGLRTRWLRMREPEYMQDA